MRQVFLLAAIFLAGCADSGYNSYGMNNLKANSSYEDDNIILLQSNKTTSQIISQNHWNKERSNFCHVPPAPSNIGQLSVLPDGLLTVDLKGLESRYPSIGIRTGNFAEVGQCGFVDNKWRCFFPETSKLLPECPRLSGVDSMNK